MEELVVLVDDAGSDVGEAEKLAAHRDGGRLHRAFSLFLVDGRGRVLLQRRSPAKHHFRGLWSNSCCSHPRPGEDVAQAAARRADQELGVSIDPAGVREVGTFTYRAEDPASGLVEHEWDHVLVARFDGDADPDPAEVDAWRWATADEVDAALAAEPAAYTPWFAPALAVLRSSR